MESYLALPDGAGRFRQDFTGPALLRIPAQLSRLRLRGYHPLWPRFPTRSTSLNTLYAGPTTPDGTPPGLGCSPFARRYSGNHYCFLFLRLLRCFSSPGWPHSCECSIRLPHSEIRGSKPICSSPQLIAALHVLHRRSMPRHPPCALNNLC